MKLFNKKYPKVVEEIHNAFFLASENLLKEAENILQKSKSQNINKGLRLLKLGFRQADQAVKAKEVKTALKLSKTDKEFVLYYRKNYPLYKFITEGQVKNICHKYNLVCGNVGLFKGFIPERNLTEIENFKQPKENDLQKYEIELVSSTRYRPAYNIDKIVENIGESMLSYIDEHGGFHLRSFGFSSTANDKGNRDYFNDIESGGHNFDRLVKSDCSLKICAPIKDMDTKGMEISEEFKLIKKSPPDPIVLQPVKGGYLIVTAWGDEASDPDIINPINN